ncbi:MAG: LamG-like jellyroll fold domain-containing protein, partial [Armatimonadota bacterium]
MRRVPSMALAAFAALNVFAAAAPAETPVDEQTVFMARFDAGPAAEIGADEVTGDGWTLVPGRFGQALRVEAGQTVAYPVEGLIEVEQGTIELWMQRWWDADEEVRSVLAGWRTPANNYVRINFVNAGRLGVAMNGGPEGATVWQRVDFDPTQWAAGSWHHVAAAWEGGAVRLYIDGERVGQVNNNSPMIEAPSRLEIGRGPVVIDDLRISSVARTDEEMLHAFTGRAPGEVTLLTDFEAFDAAQATGEVGVDTQRGIDDRTMPLMAGSRLYERGVGLRAPGRVSFEVPAGFGRLTGEVGACAFADTPGAEVAISVDGVEAFAAMVQPGGTPVAFDVTLPGACVVRIEARPGEASGGMALVGDPVLTPEGREPPEVLARQISEAAVEVQRMRMEATRFRFDLPAGEMAY